MSGPENKESGDLDQKIARAEALLANHPADGVLKKNLADLSFQKGLKERAATLYKDAIEYALRKNDYPLAFTILSKTLAPGAYDIVSIKDVLNVLITPEMADQVSWLYASIASYSASKDRALSFNIMRKLSQLDPSNEELIDLFRGMTPPAEEGDAPDQGINNLQGQGIALGTGEKISIPDQALPAGAAASVPPGKLAGEQSGVFKDKFLSVAKEKGQLESIIISQNDEIKRLERENAELTHSMRELIEKHRHMQERLVDYDIQRNMAITELTKKTEDLVAENKKLIAEKDFIIQSLERDKQNLTRVDQQRMLDILRETDALRLKVQQQEQELDSLRSKVDEGEVLCPSAEDGVEHIHSLMETKDQEIDEASSMVLELTDALDQATERHKEALEELETLRREKQQTENDLEEKIVSYHNEVATLKTDVEDLASSIEDKIRVIDTLNSKVKELSAQLTHRDTELAETVPQLLSKINQLAGSIDGKMEENSLFAKELVSLNEKIADLNRELVQKDETLISLTEEYRQEIEQIRTSGRDEDGSIGQLTSENASLRSEADAAEKRAAETAAENRQLGEELRQTRDLLAEKDSSISSLEDALRREQAGNQEQAILIASLQEDNGALREAGKSAQETAASAMAGMEQQIAELQEKLSSTESALQSLLEKEKTEQERVSSGVTAHQQEVAALHERLEEEQGSRERIEGERRDLLERISHLEQSLQQIEEAEKLRLSEMTDKDRLIREREREIADLSAALTAVREAHEAETSELRKVLQEKEPSFETLRSEHAAEKARLEAAAEELSRANRQLEEEAARLKVDLAVTEETQEPAEPTVSDDYAALKAENDHLREGASEKDRVLAEATEELSRLSFELTASQETASSLRQTLEERDKTLHSLGETHEVLTREISSLQDALAELRETPQQGAAASDEQRAATQAKIAALEDELGRLRRERETLRQEKDSLEGVHHRLEASFAGFRRTLEEKDRSIITLGEDKASLAAEVARLREAVGALEAQGSNAAGAERDRAASRATIADHERTIASLRQEIETLRSEAERLEAALVERPHVHTPPPPAAAAVDRSPRRLALLAALLLVLVLAGTVSWYYSNLLSETPQQPQIAVPVPLSYEELFSMSTRSASGKTVKVQATMLSEALVKMPERTAEERSFAFSRNFYFKITVNALQPPLSKPLVADPISRVSLTAGGKKVIPLGDPKIVGQKTFFRRDVPVSTTFYVVAPHTGVPMASAVSLNLSTGTEDIPLQWDASAPRR